MKLDVCFASECATQNAKSDWALSDLLSVVSLIVSIAAILFTFLALSTVPAHGTHQAR